MAASTVAETTGPKPGMESRYLYSGTTTEIYAKSNPEIKRKAIEKASPKLLPKEKFTAKEKEELSEWLKAVI
ncbi:MAG: hypothetical protein IMF19_03625 [Proteobacteria bacterium]|nr:hypothetical protein [Pseudomonadota bacterium]